MNEALTQTDTHARQRHSCRSKSATPLFAMVDCKLRQFFIAALAALFLRFLQLPENGGQ